MELLDVLENVEYVTRFYEWSLITADPDDNKFVDCFLASQSQYLVTHDKHFNVLKNLEFPPVEVIKLDDFKKLLG